MDGEIREQLQLTAEKYGQDISMYDDHFFEQVVEKRLAFGHVSNFNEYVRYTLESSIEIATLVRALNITHTEFFRNSLTFAHLEQWILPSLLEGKSENSELRIWSAGCSSGQEAYSIAILIENLQARKSKRLRYRIIATDINESALEHAMRGVYREADVERIRLHDVNRYFTKRGDTYTVIDGLKDQVWFHTYDLLDNGSAYPHESIFGNFDLVLCSNLLFYYKLGCQYDIMRKLINSMDANGFLITGETERQTAEKFCELYPVAPPSAIYKQRRGAP